MDNLSSSAKIEKLKNDVKKIYDFLDFLTRSRKKRLKNYPIKKNVK